MSAGAFRSTTAPSPKRKLPPGRDFSFKNPLELAEYLPIF